MAADDLRWELFRPRPQLLYLPYHGLLQHAVDRFPDKIAMVFGSQHLSFQEIDGPSSSLARSSSGMHADRMRSAAESADSRVDLGMEGS
jgi:hypothetical protein